MPLLSNSCAVVPDGSVFTSVLDNQAKVNNAIHSEFTAALNNGYVKGTHQFGGRYENLYVEASRIPAVKPVMSLAVNLAASYLEVASQKIKSGFWFNHMQPGQHTGLHSHDDYDEQLSCVYYVRVPVYSGNLVLHTPDKPTTIEPRNGQFVFFRPDLEHEVTENMSLQDRLSIGMNFGIETVCQG